MKKVYLNARVKAMISLLETFSNIVIVVVIYFTVRHTFATLFVYIIVYMIILPCTFLMNTSDNKDKVMEYGWIYLFKNVPRKSEETKFLKDSKAMKPIHSKLSKLPYDQEKQEIFTTYPSANSKVTIKKVGISQNVTFESEPCSSKGYNDTNKRHHTDITTLDVNLLSQQYHKKQNISQRLIMSMIEHLHEEEIYIEYFKELVVYTDNQSDENASLEFQLNYELLPNYIPEDTSNDEQNQRRGKRSKQKFETPNKKTNPKLDQYDEKRNQLNNKIIFKGQKKDRILIRKKILTQISACNEDEKLYIALKEELISAEESFIQ